jgi:hypothetical protein
MASVRDAEEGSSARLDRLSPIGDWGTEWSAPDSTGVRLQPCDPTEVYAHPETWTDDGDNAPVYAARVKRRSAWSRGIVSLMWAGVIATGAVQHAGEIDRRASAQEPSVAEFAMQERSGVRITAAWRDLSDRDAIAPSVPQKQENRSEPNSAAELVRLVELMQEARPRSDIAIAALPTQEPEIQGKSEGRGNTTASKEAIIQVKEDAEPQTAAETATPSIDSPRRTKAKRVASLVVSGEQAQNASQTQVNPTALRVERPVETPRPLRRWTRKSRAKEPPVEVAYVIVTPGQFVLSRYFTVYGLNGRTP